MQVIYAELLSELLMHADEEACAELNVEALPAAAYMLQQGPW